MRDSTNEPSNLLRLRSREKRVETGSRRGGEKKEEEEEDKVYGRTVVKRDEVAYRRSSTKIVPITSDSIEEDRWPINTRPYTRYRRINRVPIKFNFLRLPWLLNFLINPPHTFLSCFRVSSSSSSSSSGHGATLMQILWHVEAINCVSVFVWIRRKQSD